MAINAECPCCAEDIELPSDIEEDDEITCTGCGTVLFWDGEELNETNYEPDESENEEDFENENESD